MRMIISMKVQILFAFGSKITFTNWVRKSRLRKRLTSLGVIHKPCSHQGGEPLKIGYDKVVKIEGVQKHPKNGYMVYKWPLKVKIQIFDYIWLLCRLGPKPISTYVYHLSAFVCLNVFQIKFVFLLARAHILV